MVQDACAYLTGAKASSECTSLCVFIHKSRFWSSNSPLEGKCFVYLSHSCTTTVSRGSGGLPPEKFS